MKKKALWLPCLLVLSGLPKLVHSQASYVFSQAQFPTGATPYSVVVGDFNGDGILDLAVANADSANGNPVSILQGEVRRNICPEGGLPCIDSCRLQW